MHGTGLAEQAFSQLSKLKGNIKACRNYGIAMDRQDELSRASFTDCKEENALRVMLSFTIPVLI
jgi:hypothetical protein